MSSPLNFSISSKIKKEGRQASFQRIDISDERLLTNQETKVAHWNRFRTTALFLIRRQLETTVRFKRMLSCSESSLCNGSQPRIRLEAGWEEISTLTVRLREGHSWLRRDSFSRLSLSISALDTESSSRRAAEASSQAGKRFS
jgi:hypothetical protein